MQDFRRQRHSVSRLTVHLVCVTKYRRKVFDAGGAIKDRDLEQRLLEVGRQVARFACLHSAERAMEFLKNWECAPVNPGGAAKDAG